MRLSLTFAECQDQGRAFGSLSSKAGSHFLTSQRSCFSSRHWEQMALPGELLFWEVLFIPLFSCLHFSCFNGHETNAFYSCAVPRSDPAILQLLRAERALIKLFRGNLLDCITMAEVKRKMC